uniref:Pre-mRNA-processing factor 39 n=1 Tax=Angiostrongylus cantonensis TaxID=6313 RepID=A0A0K0CYD9_ANGCA
MIDINDNNFRTHWATTIIQIHPEAMPHFQAEIFSRRYRWHKETEAMVNARLPFEDQIKRPYFHVKPLEAEQLKNWRLYLDFEIIEGDENRITVLFERCLIACALYDQFWTKFARWTRKHRGSTEARNVYRRARQHIPGNVRLALAYSAFEESLDYKHVSNDLFRKAALKDNVQLLLQLIDLAFTNPEFSQTAVIEAFDFAIKSNISDTEKLQFSQRKLDFLEDLSYDIDILQEHQDAHVALLAELENPPITTRKRRYNGREDSKYYGDRDRDLPPRRGSRYSEHRDVRDSYRDNFRGIRETTGYYMSPNGEIKNISTSSC